MSIPSTLDRPPSRADSNGMEESVIPSDLPRPGKAVMVTAAIAFALLLIALFLIGWYPRHQIELQTDADAAAIDSGVPIVQAAAPKLSASSGELVLPADVKPYQMAALYTRSNGFLKELRHDINDRVQEGELLAVVDAGEVDAQLAQAIAARDQARANVDRAQADIDLAEVTLKRYVDAQKASPGSVTQEDLDTKKSALVDAAAALKQASANVTASDANVNQLTVLQSYERVYAPFSGTITSRNYDVGALLNQATTGTGAGKELFDIAQTDPLKVYISVPQTYATEIQMGQSASLVVRNYPGREFAGIVVRSSGSLDPATRTLLLEIHFPNPKNDLYAGMYGQVKLKVHPASPALTIPTSALIFNAQGIQVALVKDDKVHFQPITLGRDMGTELEVAAGLDEHDLVIANPGERLREGGPVKVAVSVPEAGSKPTPVAAAVAPDTAIRR